VISRSTLLMCAVAYLKSFKREFVLTTFWYNLHYKHTKKHKKELQDVEDRVLAVRKKTLGY